MLKDIRKYPGAYESRMPHMQNYDRWGFGIGPSSETDDDRQSTALRSIFGERRYR